MIWNGFLFGIGLILLSIVIMIVFGLLGVVFSTVFESIVEKKFFKGFFRLLKKKFFLWEVRKHVQFF